MDVQAEQRFQALKRRLDALQYHQPLTIESAALADKLLNDLLKTTEGFQKLKKMNEELKRQTSNDTLYYEPLKKENERVIKENNELHLLIIQTKEECEKKENSMRAQLRQVNNEKDDLNFLISQKDFKIQEQEKQLMQIKQKLDTSLSKSYNPKANDIIQGLRKEIGQQENVIGKKQEFAISRQIDANSQNQDPNRGQSTSIYNDFNTQTQIWGDELRRADERALKFRYDIQLIEQQKNEMEKRMKEMERQMIARDQEIQRLQMTYKGGQNFEQVKTTYDKQTAEETIQKQIKQIQFLNSENHRLESEMKEIKELLGICETSDPTDKDRAHLKTLVRKLKQRNDQLQSDKADMERTINAMRTTTKSNPFEDLNQTNMRASQTLEDNQKKSSEQAETQIKDLLNTNKFLQCEVEKMKQQQSAYQSNANAFAEKIEQVQEELLQKKEQLEEIEQANKVLENECTKLKEELNFSKQKSLSLQREYEMQQTFMQKLNQNSTVQDQQNFLRDRIKGLEQDIERLQREKTDQQFEIRRLQGNLDLLEKQMSENKFNSIKNDGDVQNSRVIVQRLETQVQGLRFENETFIRQKEEVEKLLKKAREEVVELEKKNAENQQQLLRSKENFQILHNEQKLLSDELTLKQTQLQKSEREKLNLERELLQLRPLKNQLESFSNSTQQQIEQNVKTEYENKQLQSKINEMKNELELKKHDFNELNNKYNQQLLQNQKLIEQLKLFEKDSYEIQARIRRGLEVENENENQTKVIEQMREKERYLNSQVEELKQIVKFKENELERVRGNLENAQRFNKQLEKEISEQREELQNMNSLINEGKTDTIKSEQRKNQAEIEILDLKKQIGQSREEKRRIENDFYQIKKEYEDEKVKALDLAQIGERQRLLIENLNKTKDELLMRLQLTGKEKKDEEQDKAILLNDINNYKKEMLAKDQEILDLKRSIEALDNNIDELQVELDQKTQDLSYCRQQMDKQIKDFSNVQHQMSVISGKEDNFQRRLFERENEIKTLKNDNKLLKEQVEELNQIVQVRSQEVQELTEDIQTLTRENMYVNSEFSKTAQANDILKNFNEELVNKEKLAQQNMRALEMEKEDILKNYRNLCLENERLQDNIQQIGKENQSLYNRAHLLEREAGGISHKFMEQESRDHQRVQEIRQLERHIDQLTHQLEMAHKVIKELQEHKDALLYDMDAQRNLSQTIEANREDLGRYVGQLEDDKNHMQLRMNDMQREMEVLRKQISSESYKHNDLEKIISNERRNVHERDMQIKELLRKNDEIKSERDRHQLRIQSLQNHIESLQKYGKMPTSNESSMILEQGRMQELEQKLREVTEKLEKYKNGDHESAYQEIERLRAENERLMELTDQYDKHMQGLEDVLQKK